MSENEIKETLQEAFELVKKYRTLEGWTNDFNDPDGRKGYFKELPGSSVHGFIAEGTLDAEPSVIVDKMWSAREDLWKKYDSSLLEWKIVKQFDDNTRLNYQANKMGGIMIWDRDVSIAVGRFQEDKKHYIIQKSVEVPDIPRNDKKYVRAKVLVAAFIFEPTENGKTRAFRIAHVDPEGSLPAFIVNQFRPNTFTFEITKAFL